MSDEYKYKLRACGSKLCPYLMPDNSCVLGHKQWDCPVRAELHKKNIHRVAKESPGQLELDI